MKRYLIAGLLVLLFALALKFPARLAYDWFAPPEVQLSGISGSVWNGSASEGRAAGAYVSDIRWKFRPSALLGGKLEFETSSSPAFGTLQTDLAVAANGELSLKNLDGNVELGLIHPSFQQSGIRGDLQLDFEELALRDGMPSSVTGEVSINNLLVPELAPSTLGDYIARFETAGDSITATLVDTDGILDVDGTLTLNADRSYTLLGRVSAKTGAPRSIVDQLQYLGTPDADGFRPFRFEGQL